MSLVLITSANNQFGGVLSTAYKQAGGPPFDFVIVLPEKTERRFPSWAKGFVAYNLFGASGTLRLFRLEYGKIFTKNERALGLDLPWIDSISLPETKVIYVDSINSKEARDLMESLHPSLLISVGSPQILKKHILATATMGAINIHNGKLPVYRGLFGTFWEVARGEPYGYVCVHRMVPQVDQGEVLAYARFSLEHMASFLDLLIAKKRAGGRLLAQVVNHSRTAGQLEAQCHDYPSHRFQKEYFGWPSLEEIARFRWTHTKKLKNRSHVP